jgi:hypothetical protein
LEIILCTIYTILFIGIIYKLPFFNIPSIPKKIIVGIFILKILIGLLLYLIYTYYYTDRTTADIFKYYDDSKILFNVLLEEPKSFFKLLFGIDSNSHYLNENYISKMQYWFNAYQNDVYNDNRIIIKLNALIQPFSFGYFNVHTIFFNFISLIGLTAIYKAVERFKIHKKVLLVIVFLIPSVIFWSSGVLKESILFFGLGIFLLNYFRLVHDKYSIKNIIYLIISTAILISIKPYVFLAIFLPLVAYFWVYKSNQNNTFLRYGITLILGLIIALNLKYANAKYDILDIISTRQNNFINLANGGIYLQDDKKSALIHIPDNQRENLIKIDETHFKIKETPETVYTAIFNEQKSGSLLNVNRLKPTLSSFLRESPQALINSLFRPYPFESSSPFIILSGLENLILFILIILVFVFRKIPDKKEVNFILLVFTFSFTLLLFIGLTTPVMGSIVRYKSPALLFLIIGLFLLIDSEKITTFLKRLFHNR